MTLTLTERLVTRIGSRRAARPSTSRRGFLSGAALVGAAIAVDPWGYLVRPASAYDAVCGTEAACADGYSVFCCTINGGSNTCPPNSFIGGWWKADNSSFCGGSARYYIDCNAFRDGAWQCHCADGTCDQRRVACNQFRYGQCSLQIPASQTGPVVCRMISCTPPWQQFGGTCTSSSATDNRTATHTAPCLVGRAPLGSLDAVAANGNAIRALGWAFDPDQSSAEIQVAVYIDDVNVGSFGTGGQRPDVNAGYGIAGNHGFDVSVTVGPGRHTMTVYALNVGAAAENTLLGSGSATIGAIPVGHLDSYTAAPDSKVRVSGWAFDPDEPGTAIIVHVYRDGTLVGWFPTGRPRPDVNSAYGITGNHGFDFSFDSPPGDHTVDVYAINVAGGAGNPMVGSGRVRVGIPMGYLDGASATGRTVRLQGWAFDPDQPQTAISIAVYGDGVLINWFPTGRPRPDLNSAYGITGDHGFVIEFPAVPGRHLYEIAAINVGPAAGNPFFGSRTVDVP